MDKRNYFLLGITLLLCTQLTAQVGINTDNSAPDSSAMLEIKSTDKGFLLPRLTTEQFENIQNPANGLMVFCADDNKFYAYIEEGDKWKALAYEEEKIIPIPTMGYSTPTSYPNMTAIWADEFNDSSLDTTKWNYQIGDGCPALCGWGNNELQYYKEENTSLQNGCLIIEAKEETEGTSNYTSSRINTQNKFSLNYGRVDIRAALPVGKGIWPALWMLGDNISTVGWPQCGEIDIMEMIGGNGQENTVHGTTHWWDNEFPANYGGSYTLPNGIFNDEFHVFTITWDAQFIRWYVDDVQFHIIDIALPLLDELQGDFHFLFNIAVGGNWPGNPDGTTFFPQHLIVDYIRVFQDN
ncbi:MAG: beta-glucanase (GH16 family) [Halioglobus sp.]|jgi:beta-glucanase (GH16 family)